MEKTQKNKKRLNKPARPKRPGYSGSSNRLLHFLNYWLPVIIWAFVIFASSSRSVPGASEIHWQDFIVKKSAHVVVYAVLTILIYRALHNNGFDKRKAGLWAILLSMFYGATDEYHQSLTPGREPTVRDVIFDTIGSILGIYALWKLLPRVPKKLKNLAEKLELI